MGGNRRLAIAVKGLGGEFVNDDRKVLSIQQGKGGAVTIPGRPLEACPRKVEGMTSIGP
jgi:hypothetical protein